MTIFNRVDDDQPPRFRVNKGRGDLANTHVEPIKPIQALANSSASTG